MTTEFILTDTNRDREKTFSSKSEAEEKKNDMVSLGADPSDLTIEVPNGATEAADSVQDAASQTIGDVPAEPTKDTEVVEDNYNLPDGGPSIDEDPLVWMPDEFTDTVDGTVTISRKGYEVLAHHYNISGGTEMVVSPVETNMEYAVHKATVTDTDGQEYTAYGEAHASDNGEENIVRMSDTRSYKRAVSRATGVGTIAIEELQNEL